MPLEEQDFPAAYAKWREVISLPCRSCHKQVDAATYKCYNCFTWRKKGCRWCKEMMEFKVRGEEIGSRAPVWWRQALNSPGEWGVIEEDEDDEEQEDDEDDKDDENNEDENDKDNRDENDEHDEHEDNEGDDKDDEDMAKKGKIRTSKKTEMTQRIKKEKASNKVTGKEMDAREKGTKKSTMSKRTAKSSVTSVRMAQGAKKLKPVEVAVPKHGLRLRLQRASMHP
ncbi:hypothetical protein C8Q78DRAFT_993202 [Trametes maxima]|nr:hypothetical protein C8Q78DRAFT_993202 [Trametes maxima]